MKSRGRLAGMLIAWLGQGCVTEASPEIGHGHQHALACGDLENDPANCGDCGVQCGDGLACSDGLCVVDPGGLDPSGLSLAIPLGTWSEKGPLFAGRMSAIIADPADTTGCSPTVETGCTLFAASPGGGVWKSTNGGSTWTWPGNSGMGDTSVLDLQWDRTTSGTLYARTWNGVYKSTNGAANWTRLLWSQRNGGDTSHFYPSNFCGSSFPTCPPNANQGPGIEPKPFTQMIIPGSATKVLLTGLPCGGLQYSYNSGVTWTQHWLSGTNTNPDNCFFSIAGDEATGRVYLSTMRIDAPLVTHVYRSGPWTTTGPPSPLTWDLANSGFPNQSPATALAWGGSADRLMAVTIDGVSPNGGVAYRSRCGTLPCDGTLVWDTKPLNGACSASIGVRPLVWGGAGAAVNEFFAGATRTQYTATAGDSWSCLANPANTHPDVRGIFANQTFGHVWEVNDGAVLGTWNVMVSRPWTPGTAPGPGTGYNGSGITSKQLFTAGVSAATTCKPTRRMIVGSMDDPVLCTDNMGVNWTDLIGVAESQAVVWHPLGCAQDLVYAHSTQGTIKRSLNAGSSSASCSNTTWTDITPPVGGISPEIRNPHSIAIHPANFNMLYALDRTSVLVSTNKGEPGSWRGRSYVPSSASPYPVSSVVVDDSGYVYVGTMGHGAYQCTDTTSFCDGSPGSGTWTEWGLNVGSPVAILSITRSPPALGSVTWWIGTTSGVYRKRAGEPSWTLVSNNPDYVFNDVVVDPSCRTRIYATIGWMGYLSQSRGGIQVSSDEGATWNSITLGQALHNLPNTQVVVDSVDPHFVYATTFGRGFWRYDWGTNLPVCL